MFAAFMSFAQTVTLSIQPEPAADTGGMTLYEFLAAPHVIGFMATTILVVAVSLAKAFTKAGQPGWAAFVPVYNAFVLLKVVGRPWWWLLLYLVPFVNFAVGLMVAHDLSKSFGRSIHITLLLVLLPFVGYPLLAFSPKPYVGPAAASAAPHPA